MAGVPRTVEGVVLEEFAGQSAGVDAEAYRSALRRHASGVVVVTATEGDQPAGLTVTSLTSLSLDPPLVSFALARSASAYGVLAATPTFVVQFLSADQAPLAIRFATSGVDRFAPPTRWTRLPTGEPLLVEAPAWLRCEVVDRVPAGDHLLVIGHVVSTAGYRPHEPLVYHAGRYASLAGDRRWWRRWRRSEVRHGAARSDTERKSRVRGPDDATV